MSIHRTNDADVQRLLSLANSSVQPGDNVSDLTNDAGYITATLTQEQVEDYAGALVATGGTKTLITVTYDDINGNMDFVVDNNLANYDNSTSGFLDAATVEAQVDHVNIANIGTNTHAQIDSHIGDGTIHFTQAAISIPASQITDFDTEVSNNTDVAANTSARHVAVTVTDSSEIDFTLTGQDITASLIAASVDETKLDVSVNASLDLADSAAQSGDNVSIFTNDANYLTAATVEAQVDHVNIASIGTNTHAQIDSHIGDGTIHFTQGAISIPASQISDFDAEVANNTDVAANTSARHVAVTVTDSSEIDFTLTGQDITAGLITGSVDVLKLDAGVQTSLGLADSAVQDSTTDTLTNKTIDATLNTISNIDETSLDVSVNASLDLADSAVQGVTDTSEIDLTLTAKNISAAIVTGSVDVLKLDSGVQTSLGKADTAIQGVTDTTEIDLTVTGSSISAALVAASIDETKLDSSVNASLDLADSATQPGDNVSTLTNDAGYITATLTQEQVEDYAGALVATGGTKTLITVTYQDTTGDMDFVVDSNLSNYDNSTSAFITAASLHPPVTVTDSAEIDFTLTGQDITASLKAGSIDETKLDTSVNASLDLADSAYQSGDSPTFAAITATTSISLGNTDTLQFLNLAATGGAGIRVDTDDKFTFREISGGGFEWEAQAGPRIMWLSAAGDLTVGGNFTLGGGIFNIGPVEVVEISDGVITYTQSSLTVQPEGLSGTDSLVTISGGSNGDILILRTGANNRDITVVNGSGNIDCGANITMLTVADRVMLMKQGSNWCLISQAVGN